MLLTYLNKNLLAKVYFPRELFPLSKIGAAVVDFLVGLTVLFGLMLFFDVSFTPGMLLLPVVMAVARLPPKSKQSLMLFWRALATIKLA